MNTLPNKCAICGEPMPPGEQMFKFHGYSGPCPKPPIAKQAEIDELRAALLKEQKCYEAELRENTRLKELLAHTRGSVKKDWVSWEQYQLRKSKEGFASHQDGSAECTQLLHLLEAIDAIIEKAGIK